MDTPNPFQLEVVSVRLVRDAPILSQQKITDPESAIAAVGELLSEMDREVVCVINLKTDGTPINCHVASMGAINYALAEPRELLKSSILSNAASMIMIHNHMSSLPKPSMEDTKITDRMLQLSALIGIPLVDHIIVGADNTEYFSFKERGYLKAPDIKLATCYEDIDFQSVSVNSERGRSR